LKARSIVKEPPENQQAAIRSVADDAFCSARGSLVEEAHVQEELPTGVIVT
jgi:hypothetical protein